MKIESLYQENYKRKKFPIRRSATSYASIRPARLLARGFQPAPDAAAKPPSPESAARTTSVSTYGTSKNVEPGAFLPHWSSLLRCLCLCLGACATRLSMPTDSLREAARRGRTHDDEDSR